MAVVDRVGASLVAGGIHAYRRWLRHRLRRECLFEVTCSEFVLRAARTGGTRQAIRAFVARCRTCRGDYSVGGLDGVPHAVSRCGIRMALEELTPVVRDEVELAYARARDSIASGR